MPCCSIMIPVHDAQLEFFFIDHVPPEASTDERALKLETAETSKAHVNQSPRAREVQTPTDDVISLALYDVTESSGSQRALALRADSSVVRRRCAVLHRAC